MITELYANQLVLSNYRPATIRTHRAVLHNLDTYLRMRDLAAATRQDLIGFLARPLAPGSRRVYRSVVRLFYSWATEEGLVTTNPAEKLPSIRVNKGVPRPIDDVDLRHALSRADARTRAWLLLMALGGLRCLEVSGLAPTDLIRNDSGWLLFLRETKGGGAGTVPAHEHVVMALAQLPVTGGLWWSCSPKQVSRYTNEFLRSVGVNATAHQLRHSAATLWLRESGHDLLTTSHLMRHKSVETTQGYAALDPTRPAAVVGAVQSPWGPLGDVA